MERYFRSISLISPLLLIVGTGVGVIRYRSLKRGEYIIWIYLVVCLGIDIISRFYTGMESNLYLIQWLSLLELILFTCFYKSFLLDKKIKVMALVGLMYILGEIFIIDSFDPKGFQPYARTVSSFIILFMSMRFMLNVVKRDIKISKKIINLNTTILVYFLVQLISLLPFNYLVNVTSSITMSIWMLNLIIHIFFYIFLIKFLWKNGRHLRRLSSGWFYSS